MASLPILTTVRQLANSFWLRTWRLITVIFAGLISGLALPRYYQWYLIFFSVSLILLAIRKLGFWRAYALGQVAGIFFYASQSTWMNAYLGPAPWLALAVLESFIFGLGIAGTALVWNFLEARVPARNQFKLPLIALAIASLWICREWIAARFPYGGYAWSRLAQTQADSLLARWAFWGGLSAVSFVVAYISALGLLLFLHRRNRPWYGLASVALVVLVPAFTLIPNQTANQLTVASVQGNANAGLFANPKPGSILAKHLDETERLLADADFAAVDVVVWPENASDLDPTNLPIAKTAVEELVDLKLKVPLVLGAVTYRGDEIFNTVLQFEPGRGVVDYYDKRRPVPFAEYVPDRPFWFALAPDLIGLITHGFSFGERDGILDVAGTKAGTLICFEITIDDVVHDLITGGATVIFSQANNSDFGHTDETFQQESFARLQAIATGRSVVHVSTVGVTEMIRPDGTVSQSLVPFKPGYLIEEISLNVSITPAMALYGWLDATAGFLASILLIYSIVWRFRKRPSKT